MTDFASLTIEWGTVPDSITLLALMKQQLDITDSALDVELSMYVEMAGKSAERYIDNIIEQRDVVERFATVSQPIALRYWPTISLTSVEIDSVDVTSEYYLYFQTGMGWTVKNTNGSSRSSTFNQMDITYTAGFSDPIPADLGFAIVQSALSYKTGAAGGPVKRESIVGVGSVEYATGDESGGAVRVGQLPASAVAVLDQYKRIFA